MSETPVMNAEDAEEYTQALGQIVAGGWRQVALGKRLGVPQALGLSVQEWVNQRLGGYVRMSIGERREAVAELAEEGMSTREAAEVLGVDQKTVSNDRRAEESSSDQHVLPNTDEGFEFKPEELSSGEEPLSEDQEEAGEAVAEFDERHVEVVAAPPSEEPEPKVVEEYEPEPEPEPAEMPEKSSGPHVANNSGDNEWYTPIEFIKAAHAVMGGIDLDPASSESANDIIEAGTFFDEDTDGLLQPWHGRVWMNPPYAQPWVDKFCAQLARSYASGEVTEACVLVNNATETTWFQSLAAVASAMCFPRGRVKFWHPRKESMPLQGQSVVYLGQHVSAFKAEFLPFGFAAVIR